MVEKTDRWFLVMTKPKMEGVASEHLVRQGYEVYLPYWTNFKKKRDSWKLVQLPMFPRYIFVRLSRLEQSVSPICSTRGVSQLVKFGVELALASDDLVSGIRDLEKKCNDRSECLAPFQKGEHVEVIDGPFKGVSAEVLSCDQQRVILLLQVLGKSQQLVFEASACQAN